MKKRRKTDLQKEKIIMMAASVFVLTALTMTGIYVKEKNQDNKDGYVVDFSKIEEQANEETPARIAEQIKNNNLANNDLDIDPQYQEANSARVQIPGISTLGALIPGTNIPRNAESVVTLQGEKEETANVEPAKVETAKVEKQYSFEQEEFLQWPIVGNVLLNYSMDKTIYFPTLEQYKYNPALVIAAVKGEPIVAAADGKIKEIFKNEEIGNAITISLGNGYELTYGQLQDIAVSKGEDVTQGQIVAHVSEPSKYYSLEGSNVYFQMTKDGEAVNPMSKLQ